MTGTDVSIAELENFARNARDRSATVQEVVEATTSVHLGHNVMGVVGAAFVSDAGACLANIVGKMANTRSALTGDAEAADGAAKEYDETEKENTDTFTRTDTR